VNVARARARAALPTDGALGHKSSPTTTRRRILIVGVVRRLGDSVAVTTESRDGWSALQLKLPVSFDIALIALL